MKYHTQANLHDPENGVFGDCYRTCLACILDLERDEVPHYVDTMDPGKWAKIVQPKYDAWLGVRGWQELCIPIPGEGVEVEDILHFHKTRTPFPTTAMLIGESRTGCNHIVVVENGKIIHDTSINKSGIIGPGNDGFYWLTWLINIHGDNDDG